MHRFTACRQLFSSSQLISCLRPDEEGPIKIADAHTHHGRDLPSEETFLNIYSLLLVCQFEVEFSEECAHELVYICCRHGLADTLPPAEAKMHEKPRFWCHLGTIPPRGVKDIMFRPPNRRVVMKRMVTHGYRGLEAGIG
jgi:hypothetical protein